MLFIVLPYQNCCSRLLLLRNINLQMVFTFDTSSYLSYMLTDRQTEILMYIHWRTKVLIQMSLWLTQQYYIFYICGVSLLLFLFELISGEVRRNLIAVNTITMPNRLKFLHRLIMYSRVFEDKNVCSIECNVIWIYESSISTSVCLSV